MFINFKVDKVGKLRTEDIFKITQKDTRHTVFVTTSHLKEALKYIEETGLLPEGNLIIKELRKNE